MIQVPYSFVFLFWIHVGWTTIMIIIRPLGAGLKLQLLRGATHRTSGKTLLGYALGLRFSAL